MMNLLIVLCVFTLTIPVHSRALFPYMSNINIHVDNQIDINKKTFGIVSGNYKTATTTIHPKINYSKYSYSQRFKRDTMKRVVKIVKVKHTQSGMLKLNKSMQTLEDKWQPFRSVLVSIKKDILRDIQLLENSTDETNKLLAKGTDLSTKAIEFRNKTEYNNKMRNRSFSFERSQFQKFKANIFHLKNRTNSEEIKAMTFEIPEFLKASPDDAFEYSKTRADQIRDDLDYHDVPVGHHRYHSLRSFPRHPIRLALGHPAARLAHVVPAIDDELEHVDDLLNRILNRRTKRSSSQLDREVKTMYRILNISTQVDNIISNYFKYRDTTNKILKPVLYRSRPIQQSNLALDADHLHIILDKSPHLNRRFALFDRQKNSMPKTLRKRPKSNSELKHSRRDSIYQTNSVKDMEHKDNHSTDFSNFNIIVEKKEQVVFGKRVNRLQDKSENVLAAPKAKKQHDKHVQYVRHRLRSVRNVDTKKTWHDLKRVVTKSKSKDVRDKQNELPDIGLKPLKLNKGIDFSLEPLEAENRALLKKDKELMTPHDVEMDKLMSEIQVAKSKLREETFITDDDLTKLNYAQEQVGRDIKMLEENQKNDTKYNENRNIKKQKEIDRKLSQIKEDLKDLDKIKNEEKEKARKLLTNEERKRLSEKEMEIQYYKLIAKVLEGFV